MSKRKAPKFNTVLEDFRRFIGESKEAEESQGKSESSVALGKSDKEVVQELPGAGKTKGGPTEPVSNKGVDATQKLPGTSEPSKEEPSRKECAPSSKVAEEDAPSDLVNRLLSNIKLAVEAIETEEQKEASANVEAKKELTGEQAKLDLNENEKIDAEDLKNLRDGKPAKKATDESEASEAPVAEELSEESQEESKEAESHCDTADNSAKEVAPEKSDEESEEKEEEEAEEEKEESKEASEDCQKPECGKCGSEKKETLEIDEDKLAEKIAAHYRNISVGYELGKFLFSSLGEKVAEEPVAQAQEQGGSEIDLILQALQELVASGEITEEQAQNVLMQLQAASEGGAAPEAAAAPEEPKMASELFTEEEIKEIEANINSKVAEWVAEGKTDAEITELVKQAAQEDAKLLSEASEVSEEDKTAQEVEKKIVEAVEAKVAELKEAGATEEQIEQFLTKAAKEDAKLLVKAAQQEKIAAEILQKVEAKRQEKVANVSPEVQQILQALEALLQSGQITEEEAMMVLQELGLAEGAPAAEAAPAAAPEAPAAESAEEAPVAKEEDK